MKIRSLSMAEMKASRCSQCISVPKYKILDNDGTGALTNHYLCEQHYRDFIAVRNRPPSRCEWCGNTDARYHNTQRFGEDSGRCYQVCTPCMELQEEHLAEEFGEDEDPEYPPEDPVPPEIDYD